MRLLLLVLGSSLVLCVRALYSSSDDVVELTQSNFEREVIQSESLWLVEFYAPWCGHCQSLAPEWKKAATALKGIVKIGAVDADQHQSLGGQYGIKGFPTIKIFGANKRKPVDYPGGRNAKAIVDTAMSALSTMVSGRLSGNTGGSNYQRSSGGSKKDVVELTDANFEKLVLQSDDVWMVEFFAPWCGHCKKLEPEWAAAATAVKEETRDKVHLGAVDATLHATLSSNYGIRGYPTIKVFRKGQDPEDYNGGRSQEDIKNRALELYAEIAPPPEVLEILNEDIVKNNCGDSPLCVIAVLPDILDSGASGRNSYLDTLKKMADKYKVKKWGWLWTAAGVQVELEASLGIGGFGYPTMAAVNSRKMKFTLLKGSFSETGIHEFLRELSFGRGSTSTWGTGVMPKIRNTEAWDGKDGQLPEEEEYDLSDVDLSDDVEAKIEL